MHRLSSPSFKQGTRNVKKRDSPDKELEDETDVTGSEVIELLTPLKVAETEKSVFDILKAPAPVVYKITSLSGYSIQSLISDWYDNNMSDNSTWDCVNSRDKRRVIPVMKYIISFITQKKLNILETPPAVESGERAKWRQEFKALVSELEARVMFDICKCETEIGIKESSASRSKKALVSAVASRLDEIRKKKAAASNNKLVFDS